MNNADLNIKVSENEELLLRTKIDDSQSENGIIIFDLSSVTDGKTIFKFQLKDDKLTVLEKAMEIGEDFDSLKEKLEEFLLGDERSFSIESIASRPCFLPKT